MLPNNDKLDCILLRWIACKKVDNMFKGAIISVMANNIVDTYMWLPTSKEMWMHLRPNSEFLMLALSCMSLSNFMTTEWAILKWSRHIDTNTRKRACEFLMCTTR